MYGGKPTLGGRGLGADEDEKEEDFDQLMKGNKLDKGFGGKGKGAINKAEQAKIEAEKKKEKMAAIQAARDAVKGPQKTEAEKEEERLLKAFKDKAVNMNPDNIVEVDTTREPASMVFIGHVDAGKSTICGNLMFLTGVVD
jgi:peptide chain release factor subunit 3